MPAQMITGTSTLTSHPVQHQSSRIYTMKKDFLPQTLVSKLEELDIQRKYHSKWCPKIIRAPSQMT